MNALTRLLTEKEDLDKALSHIGAAGDILRERQSYLSDGEDTLRKAYADALKALEEAFEAIEYVEEASGL